MMIFLVIGGWIFPQIATFSETVTLVNSLGESIDLAIEPSDKFLNVLDKIQSCLQTADYAQEKKEELDEEQTVEVFSLNHPHLLFQFTYAGMTIRSKTMHCENYDVPVNRDEKNEITFVLRTLSILY